MITGEQVKNAMIAAGIEKADHHKCGICGYMTAYLRDGDQLFFDPGCYCSDGFIQLRGWESPAEWINMQTNLEGKKRVAEKFGLDLPEDA